MSWYVGNPHSPSYEASYIDGILGQWLLVPDSFELHKEAEVWVDAGIEMISLSLSLRN